MRIALIVFCCLSSLHAAMVEVPVTTGFEGGEFSGTIVYDDASQAKRPGLLMIPNWMGPTEASLVKAKKIAAMGFVVYMADMYGVDIRPQDAREAAQAAGAVRADRELMRRRAAHHLSILVDHAAELPIDATRLAALGFCFGGGTVLELARSGSTLAGVVSFHGNLDTPDAAIAEQIVCKILVLHGNDDPFVPREQVLGFFDEMQAAEVDYQFIAYGGAVHSFTDPHADMAGKAEYNELVATRSFAAMRQFFAELFATSDQPE